MLKEKSGPLKPHLSGFYFDREFIETLTEEQIKELQEENESTKRRRQRIIKDAEKEKDLKQMMLSTRQALQVSTKIVTLWWNSGELVGGTARSSFQGGTLR